jgi:hypothetical protein
MMTRRLRRENCYATSLLSHLVSRLVPRLGLSSRLQYLFTSWNLLSRLVSLSSLGSRSLSSLGSRSLSSLGSRSLSARLSARSLVGDELTMTRRLTNDGELTTDGAIGHFSHRKCQCRRSATFFKNFVLRFAWRRDRHFLDHDRPLFRSEMSYEFCHDDGHFQKSVKALGSFSEPLYDTMLIGYGPKW